MHNIGKPYKPARLVALKNTMATNIRNSAILVTKLEAATTCTISPSVKTCAQLNFLLYSCCLSVWHNDVKASDKFSLIPHPANGTDAARGAREMGHEKS